MKKLLTTTALLGLILLGGCDSLRRPQQYAGSVTLHPPNNAFIKLGKVVAHLQPTDRLLHSVECKFYKDGYVFEKVTFYRSEDKVKKERYVNYSDIERWSCKDLLGDSVSQLHK